MSGHRNSFHRRSLPVIISEPPKNQRQQRLHLQSGFFDVDLPVSSFGSLVDDSDTSTSSYKSPTAIFHHNNEESDRFQNENPSDEYQILSRLPDDVKRDQVEELKIKFYRNNTHKGNLPRRNSYAAVYLAGNKEERDTLWDGRRSRSFSSPEKEKELTSELELDEEGNDEDDVPLGLKNSDEFEDINITTEFLKLPSIQNDVTNSRHTVSASKTKIKHVRFTIDDESRMGNRRKQNTCTTGIQDTSLDKDLSSKVKEFLQKPQPRASIPSLRVKKIPDIKLQVRGNVYNSGVMGQIIGVPINTDTCPLMSHFLKDRRWYYQDKSGKCRYLRVPESPPPPISFVFAKD